MGCHPVEHRAPERLDPGAMRCNPHALSDDRATGDGGVRLPFHLYAADAAASEEIEPRIKAQGRHTNAYMSRCFQDCELTINAHFDPIQGDLGHAALPSPDVVGSIEYSEKCCGASVCIDCRKFDQGACISPRTLHRDEDDAFPLPGADWPHLKKSVG
jgi:hypothetical protein